LVREGKKGEREKEHLYPEGLLFLIEEFVDA
jgi:hypothetical protein